MISRKTLGALLVMLFAFVIGCGKTADSGAVPTTSNTPSSSKDITAFSILGQLGTIGATTIDVTVPVGTNMTALIATFTITGSNVNIAGTSQVSGNTTNDFTSAKIYTVIAADGSTKEYTVTVTACVPVLMGGKSTCALSLSADVTTPAGSGVAGAADGTGTAATFNQPNSITTDGTNLYVADMNNHKVRKIVISSGVVTTLAGSGASGAADGTGTAATFSFPAGVTTDGTNVYVADMNNHKVRKIVISSGVVTTLAGSGVSGNAGGTGTAAMFNNPQDITTDGTNLFVVDRSGCLIRQVVIASTVVTNLAGNGGPGFSDGTGTGATFSSPVGITTDGTNLYVGDSGNRRIRRIVIASRVVTTLAGSGTTGAADGTGTAATFNEPAGLTINGTSLFVADRGNHKIRRIH
jgi:hypothetical protein